MKIALCLTCLLGLFLAACGVNGPPQPPKRADGSQPPVVNIQGEGRIGVGGSF